jgi:hypothetical protein
MTAEQGPQGISSVSLVPNWELVGQNIIPIDGMPKNWAKDLVYFFKAGILDLSTDPSVGPFPCLRDPNRQELFLISNYFHELMKRDLAKGRKLDNGGVLFTFSDNPQKVIAELEATKNLDHPCNRVVLIVNRERGGYEALLKAGIEVDAIFMASQINKFCSVNSIPLRN